MFDTTKFENVASKMNNDSEADDTTENTMEAKLTPIEELRMELTTEGAETYTSYEVFVDIGRWMAKEISVGNDQYEPVYDWAIENKKEYREKAADLPGNLPLFRRAFPAESRDVWVLPSAEAAKVGIDYDNEDHIALPVINGKKWNPKTDFLPESDDSEETADEPEEQPEVDGINPADFTIPELQAELLSVDSIDELIEIEDREIAGKDRKGALKAIEVAANGLEAEAEVEQESDDSEETAEVPAETDTTDVEAAKLEALTALTETLNAVNETVQSL